jgi:hypothetical protein
LLSWEVLLELSSATEHSNDAATALYLEPSGHFRTHRLGPFDVTGLISRSCLVANRAISSSFVPLSRHAEQLSRLRQVIVPTAKQVRVDT